MQDPHELVGDPLENSRSITNLLTSSLWHKKIVPIIQISPEADEEHGSSLKESLTGQLYRLKSWVGIRSF